MTRALKPSDYLRTRVIGFSVTQTFWSALYAAIPNPSNWEMLWYSGGSVDTWANPFHNCWLGNSGVNGALINSTDGNTDPTTSPNSIDRVIFTVSGFSTATASHTGNLHSTTTVDNLSTVNDLVLGMAVSGTGIPANTTIAGFSSSTSITLSQAATQTSTGTTLTFNPQYGTNGYPPAGPSVWTTHISQVIANIRAKYPSVRMIILEPNLAGASFASCPDSTNSDSQAHGVRCTFTHPYVQSAIASLVSANVREGFIHPVDACNFFSDFIGHLTTSAQTTIGQAVASYYASNL